MLVSGIISGSKPNGFIDSQILHTQLAFSREFTQFYNQPLYNEWKPPWEHFGPVPGGAKLESNKSLASALEELHQNLTLALFSFLPITTNTYSTNVSSWRSVNVYGYTQQDLLLSYGLGALMALVPIVYGIYTAIILTGAHIPPDSPLIFARFIGKMCLGWCSNQTMVLNHFRAISLKAQSSSVRRCKVPMKSPVQIPLTRLLNLRKVYIGIKSRCHTIALECSS